MIDILKKMDKIIQQLCFRGRFTQNYKKIDFKNYQKKNVRNHKNAVPFFL